MATLEFNKAELFTVPLSCCILLYARVNRSLTTVTWVFVLYLILTEAL